MLQLAPKKSPFPLPVPSGLLKEQRKALLIKNKIERLDKILVYDIYEECHVAPFPRVSEALHWNLLPGPDASTHIMGCVPSQKHTVASEFLVSLFMEVG